jgi:Ca2+-binding EF-hand superfamily protein
VEKMMKKILFVTLMLSFVVYMVVSGQNVSKNMEKTAHDSYKMLLKETDKNKDGKISKTEFYAVWKDQKIAEEKYKAWDTNKDGYITEDEYVKVIMDMGKKKKK